jgi:hypothetical protein
MWIVIHGEVRMLVPSLNYYFELNIELHSRIRNSKENPSLAPCLELKIGL